MCLIETPTQFIRRAALKTGTVVTPTPWRERPADKKIRKSEANQVRIGDFTGVVMMDPDMVDVADDYCWLCGGATGGRGLPVPKIIKDTFTDRDKARFPASSSVCPGCVFCLSFLSLRNYSILATEEGLRHPARPEIRDLLLDPPEPPFVFCIAVTGQKWLHFRSQVAYSQDDFPVQYEETLVYIDRPALAWLLGLVEPLYAVFTKAEIISGQYSQNRIKQFGLAEFQHIEKELAPHRGSRLFNLAVFVAQKPPEKEKEKGESVCITTSIPTMKTQQPQLF